MAGFFHNLLFSAQDLKKGKGHITSLIIYPVLTPYFKDGRGQLRERDFVISSPGNDDRRDGEQYCGKIPGQRGDCLGAPGYPLDVPRISRAGKPGRPRADGAWRGKGGPCWYLGHEPCGMGRCSVRNCEDRRYNGEHQPGIPNLRAGVRPQTIRNTDTYYSGTVQDLRLRRDCLLYTSPSPRDG